VANHPSAEKRNRQRTKRALRNRSIKSTVRTYVKRVRTAIEKSGKAEAAEALKKAIVVLDKAASKGAVHRKAASRVISRLASQVHKLALPVPPSA
jgi:small subunit ribosomal protein S20